MFYVSGTKVYLTTFDSSKKVFPEVRLIKDAAGKIRFEVLKTGISVKPVHRELCTRQEVLAKFGSSVPEYSPKSEK